MQKDDCSRAIIELIASLLNTPYFNPPADQDLRSCGMDSIKTIVLIVRLEERFGIVFDDAELWYKHFATLRKINQLVWSKLR
ncbi:acyl carrier protein [Gorillibacterium sp. sgz500922]|uniref:acyl carrier protein n=1 Tax=Gorillibacterium sp. sgz500922 TaxID=3446694 RepID=UPI003F67C0D6